MLYTKQLLSRYLTGSYALDELSKTLTHHICEVEEAHERTLPDLVVIGKVLSATKHPDADKLTVCQLDCGRHGHFQICTGATNIRENIFVPVALPGCFLPAINLQIDPRKMRGLDSNGMICSKEELGIGEDVGLHGIWILQDGNNALTGDRMIDGDFTDITDKSCGVSLKEYAPWLENRIVDIENKTITHRPDLFGHRGIAREINALFTDKIRFSRLPALAEALQGGNLRTTLHQATPAKNIPTITSGDVGAYCTIELQGAVVHESSFHQRLALIDLGMTPKNNWIDFGSYFMYLTGQPIHCFDADMIEGTITVRNATEGEHFIDLFDTEHTLTAGDIVITDDKKVLALAGVIGGKSSAINEKTTNIIIEIAQFDPVVTRKSAMRLGIRTDAATRFEKHIFPYATRGAVLMCLDELAFLGAKELGAFTIQGVSSWVREDTPSSRRIGYDAAAVDALLGTELGAEKIQKILFSLGCLPGVNNQEIILPIWRGTDDLHHQADIAEEVARIVGFDALPSAQYSTPIQSIPFNKRINTVRTVEDMLCFKAGYSQVETYPWIHDRWHAFFAISESNALTMENSMTPEQKHLRTTMIPSLLEVVEKNAPFYDTLRIFDIGAIWANAGGVAKESNIVSVLWYGANVQDWQNNGFIALKQEITTLLAAFCDSQTVNRTHAHAARSHSNQHTDLYVGNLRLGTIATLHPKLLDAINVSHEMSCVVAEIDLDALSTLPKQDHQEPRTLQDQIIQKDISFVLPRAMPYGTVSDALLLVPGIKSVALVDLYEGGSISSDEKSISLRFEILGDGTLTTEQIGAIMSAAIAAGEGVGARLR